jgi:hypothetical protein
MNKEALWSLMLQNNPRLVEDPHFTPESARRFFDIIWNVAYERGAKDMVERQHEIAENSDEPAQQDFIKFLVDALERLTDESPNPKKKKQ